MKCYTSQKTEQKVTLGNLKRCLSTRNLNTTRLHKMTVRDMDIFGQRWNTFINELGIDNNTVNSWYLVIMYLITH